MGKLYIPYAHAKSIYDVDINFFINENVKYILVDLDNTLDSYLQKEPTEKVFSLKEKLELAGIKMFILSNNTGKRVSYYANLLGVGFVNSVGKPFAFGINKFLKTHKISKNEVILVGDQLMTDIAAANRAHIKSIYTEKLVKEDQPTTRFNRIFERPVKKKLIKKNLLKDWKEIEHGRN